VSFTGVIAIPDNKDYFFKKYRHRAMIQWLEDRNIEFFCMSTLGDIPHTIVTDSESALALRLQFGI
jgi:hypothetical protein